MGTGRKEQRRSKTQTQTSLSPEIFTTLLLILADYRMKMPVTEVILFPDGNSYYVCPRCHITMEREFMNFCDRCAQHLDWKKPESYILASVIPYIPDSLKHRSGGFDLRSCVFYLTLTLYRYKREHGVIFKVFNALMILP